MNLNKVILIGRLGKDPEKKDHGSFQITRFSLATSDYYKDKETGELKSNTQWHNIVIFNPYIIDTAEKYLHKGDQVYIEGSLKYRTWKNKEGSDDNITEIILSGNSTLKIINRKDNDKKLEQQIKNVEQDALISDDEIPF